jgi:hypothetical protein
MQESDLNLSIHHSSSESFSGAARKQTFPIGIRCIFYSFMTVKELLDTVCKISKKDRKQITKSEILD